MWQNSCEAGICTNEVDLHNISLILYQSVKPKYTDKTKSKMNFGV